MHLCSSVVSFCAFTQTTILMDTNGVPEPRPAESNKTQAGHRLAELSIRYPVTVCMIFISFIVLGLVSVTKIPLVLTPDIVYSSRRRS